MYPRITFAITFQSASIYKPACGYFHLLFINRIMRYSRIFLLKCHKRLFANNRIFKKTTTIAYLCRIRQFALAYSYHCFCNIRRRWLGNSLLLKLLLYSPISCVQPMIFFRKFEGNRCNNVIPLFFPFKHRFPITKSTFFISENSFLQSVNINSLTTFHHIFNLHPISPYILYRSSPHIAINECQVFKSSIALLQSV